MNTNEITYDSLPQAIGLLINEVSELKSLLVEKQKPTEKQGRIPMGIDAVCTLTGKAKPTIYALVRQRIIPSCKAGKKLYFFEDEILEWIKSGKRKTGIELKAEIENYSQNKRR